MPHSYLSLCVCVCVYRVGLMIIFLKKGKKNTPEGVVNVKEKEEEEENDNKTQRSGC